MEEKADNFDMKRSRLLDRQMEHVRDTEELLETATRLNHTVEALEMEIKKTEQDIHNVHKTYHRSKKRSESAKRWRARRGKAPGICQVA